MAIRLHGVRKSYRVQGAWREVLRGVDAEFLPGETIGILGHNGAGKTTLLRLIAGVELPSAGRVERGLSVSWPLGFAGAWHSSLSGADNARFVARIYGLPVARTVASVEAFAELGDWYGMPVRTYSSGMQLRLGFALSLAVEFECYLVDEVIAAGDVRFAERCRAALAERRARSAILFVSHVPELVRAFCDSAAILKQGKLIRYDDLDQAIAAYRAA